MLDNVVCGGEKLVDFLNGKIKNITDLYTLKVEDIENGAKWASEAGLDVHLTFMFGHAWEGPAEIAATVALARKLLAKGSSGNGQIRYGADVINRIIQQGRPGGKKNLQDAIIKETLNPIIANLCKSAGISANAILRLCVAANTTMNHLFVGVDAEPVRMEPYIPAFFKCNSFYAANIARGALIPSLNINGSLDIGSIFSDLLASVSTSLPK